MDRISKAARSINMSKVRNRDTDIEVQLRKLLWDNKLRYRKHYKVIGKPDIAFPGYKIAVFCDGDFWHGKDYLSEKKNYDPFWKKKIQINIDRDKKVNRELKKMGWVVFRFWKSDIHNKTQNCVDKIKKSIERI